VIHARDKDLARRMLGGDECAFDEFFDSNFQRLYRFALARLGNDPEDAEEVAQTTLCKAISKISTYRGEAALYTWLCTFCRHEIHALIEKKQRQPRSVDLIEELPEIRAALESLSLPLGSGPEHAFRRGEISRQVQLALDHLPSHYGNALEWKYMEGLSVKTIAERMGLSPKAVESLLTRAREAFREGFVSLARVDGEVPATPTTSEAT